MLLTFFDKNYALKMTTYENMIGKIVQQNKMIF